jgi:hypothetical protein
MILKRYPQNTDSACPPGYYWNGKACVKVPETLYVDPNDPAGRARYQAYQDSLYNYNYAIEEMSRYNPSLKDQKSKDFYFKTYLELPEVESYNITKPNTIKSDKYLNKNSSQKPDYIIDRKWTRELDRNDPDYRKDEKSIEYLGYSHPKTEVIIADNPKTKIIAKQQQLIDAGFDIGKADGIWGDKSKAAWEEFQNKVNGEIKNTDPTTLVQAFLDANVKNFQQGLPLNKPDDNMRALMQQVKLTPTEALTVGNRTLNTYRVEPLNAVQKNVDPFEQFKNSLPENLKNTNPEHYNLRGYWEALGKPTTFDYTQPKENDGFYHAFSRNPETGLLLKTPKHPTFNLALEEDKKAGYLPYSDGAGNIYTFSKDDTIPPGLKPYNPETAPVLPFPTAASKGQPQAVSVIPEELGPDSQESEYTTKYMRKLGAQKHFLFYSPRFRKPGHSGPLLKKGKKVYLTLPTLEKRLQATRTFESEEE